MEGDTGTDVPPPTPSSALEGPKTREKKRREERQNDSLKPSLPSSPSLASTPTGSSFDEVQEFERLRLSSSPKREGSYTSLSSKDSYRLSSHSYHHSVSHDVSPRRRSIYLQETLPSPLSRLEDVEEVTEKERRKLSSFSSLSGLKFLGSSKKLEGGEREKSNISSSAPPSYHLEATPHRSSHSQDLTASRPSLSLSDVVVWRGSKEAPRDSFLAVWSNNGERRGGGERDNDKKSEREGESTSLFSSVGSFLHRPSFSRRSSASRLFVGDRPVKKSYYFDGDNNEWNEHLEAGRREEGKSKRHCCGERWRISALLGMFLLLVFHEWVSYNNDNAANLQRLTGVVLDTINQTFGTLQDQFATNLRGNISAFLAQASEPADSLVKVLRQEYFALPIYEDSSQLSGDAFYRFDHKFMQNLLKAKQRGPRHVSLIAFGYDNDGTLIAARDWVPKGGNRDADQFAFGLPRWQGVPDGATACSIGEYAAAGYELFDVNRVGLRTCPTQAWSLHYCRVDGISRRCSTMPAEQLAVGNQYNALNRTWYASVREAWRTRGRGVDASLLARWSPPYRFASVNELGISYGVPYIRRSIGKDNQLLKEEFLGVVLADVRLSSIAEFIRGQMPFQREGVIFIVERTTVLDPHKPNLTTVSGRLLMTSTTSQNSTASIAPDMPLAVDAGDMLVRNTSLFLFKKFGGWQNILRSPLQMQFDTSSSSFSEGGAGCDLPTPRASVEGTNCVRVVVIKVEVASLDWLVVVALPQQEYLQDSAVANLRAMNVIDNLVRDVRETLSDGTSVVAGLACGWVFISLLLALKGSYAVSKPLKILAKDMEKVATLDLRTPLPPIRSRLLEVHRMYQSYLCLREGIELFAKFVPASVVRRIVAGDRKASQLHISRRVVTVLLCDIENFTGIAESLSLSALVSLLSEYLSAMVQLIEDSGGIIVDFIGDGIMAVWNSPEDVPNHEIQACDCALRMHAVLLNLSSKWEADGLPKIRSRIGISTGQVLSGNIGSPVKMKFGVTGQPVEVANTLEELNKKFGTQRLVTAHTAEKAKERFLLRPVGFLPPKSSLSPSPCPTPASPALVPITPEVVIYELMGLQEGAPAKMSDLRAITLCAFESLQRDQLLEALQKCEEGVQKYVDDLPLMSLREDILRRLSPERTASSSSTTTSSEE